MRRITTITAAAALFGVMSVGGAEAATNLKLAHFASESHPGHIAAL